MLRNGWARWATSSRYGRSPKRCIRSSTRSHPVPASRARTSLRWASGAWGPWWWRRSSSAGSRAGRSGAALAGAGQCDETDGHGGPADDGPDALAVHERARRDDAEALDEPDRPDEDEGHADDYPQDEHGCSLARPSGGPKSKLFDLF